MGVDFVQQIRLIARRSERLRRREPRMVIKFNTGYSATLTKDGIMCEEVISSFWACGLAVYFAAGDRRTIMNYGHHKLHHEMPALVTPRPPMYIRAKHADNDSAAKFIPKGLAPMNEDQRRVFKHRFNVEEDAVKALFAALDAPRGTG